MHQLIKNINLRTFRIWKRFNAQNESWRDGLQMYLLNQSLIRSNCTALLHLKFHEFLLFRFLYQPLQQIYFKVISHPFILLPPVFMRQIPVFWHLFTLYFLQQNFQSNLLSSIFKCLKTHAHASCVPQSRCISQTFGCNQNINTKFQEIYGR